MKSNNRGFTIVEVAIVATLILAIGGIGYVAYQNISKSQDKPEATTAQAVVEKDAEVKVESTKDLDTVTTQLDEVPVDDTDTASFDEAVDGF